ELPAGEALGVDVADLLHLQRRLQGQRIARPASNEVEAARVLDLLGDLLDSAESLVVQQRSDLGRGPGYQLTALVEATVEGTGRHRQNRDLGGEALGREHATLRPRSEQNGEVSQAVKA